jgi:hypothetical protein
MSAIGDIPNRAQLQPKAGLGMPWAPGAGRDKTGVICLSICRERTEAINREGVGDG